MAALSISYLPYCLRLLWRVGFEAKVASDIEAIPDDLEILGCLTLTGLIKLLKWAQKRINNEFLFALKGAMLSLRTKESDTH